tara:strand:+ start:1868 stop:2338 length:471 start_codon:yes stop_codon:yes gene_type:complete
MNFDRFIFRGKRVDNGAWVYGFLSFIYVDGKNENGFIYTNKAQIYSQQDARSYEVLLDTVGQCAGFKDKNNRLVFDGDLFVIENVYPFFSEGENNYIGQVEYVEGKDFMAWYYELHCINSNLRGCACGEQLSNVANYGIKIIGNIHENPELMEVYK